MPLDAHAESKPEKRPAWQVLRLGLTGLFTAITVTFFVIAAALVIFPGGESSNTGCLVMTDETTGIRGIPNCVCTKTGAETEPAEYRFDACGYRSVLPCGPKKPGTLRIVLAGSSFGFGMYVQADKSFAALLPGELSARAGRPVELYNESMQWGYPRSVLLRFNDVLAQKPDLILWDLTPEDIRESNFVISETDPAEILAARNKPVSRAELVSARLVGVVSVLSRHVLYASRSQYVTSYLAGSDTDAGFLKAQFSPQWQQDLRQFDRAAAAIEARAQAAGIPLVAVLLPSRAQAAMIAAGEWPAGYDPYHLDNELRRILESHGGTYLSILSRFQTLPNPEKDFFPVDGHMYPEGHALVAHLLADQLTAGQVPALTPTAASPKRPGQGQ